MTPQQLAILNALVTFAAEHIPGGLSEDEREVAKIVGEWALNGEIPKPSTTRWDEFWRVIHFLDRNKIHFERVNDSLGFDRDMVAVDGHRIKNLANQYVNTEEKTADANTSPFRIPHGST